MNVSKLVRSSQCVVDQAVVILQLRIICFVALLNFIVSYTDKS